ncbi:Alcohol dehydrogenase-like 7 [Striga hermonthica]|uniref:Alcohol dehydrogenase-like 7 n=1 Tax=Striga hermonthica TaxID=68872 RepID=A0A9N7NBQ2_STRHE|nr:Alcohol dehydrogenase-like 7 [Striga hermonthica]
MDNPVVSSGKTVGKPIKCRAAVARKAGEPLVIEEVFVGPPKSEEVRMKIICTSLCHSDITIWKMESTQLCMFRIYITKIDPTMPPNKACLLSCGASTGVGAAWKSAKVEAGSTVAIFGLGSVGLSVAEGARLCGAVKIIGVDVNPDKFDMSKAFGVTDFVDSRNCGEKRLSEVINEMTGGGADFCFECVGKASLVDEAFACCRKGWGKTIVVGVDKPDSQLTFGSFDVLHLGKTIMGSLFGGLKPKRDVPILVKRYMDKV